MWWCKHKLSNR